jgi:hypothetical protein
MVGVGAVQGGQRVVLDALRLEKVQPAHHPVEGRLSAFVDAVGVVQRLRPVDADADQEIVRLKKAAQASSSSVPLVWIVYSTCIPGLRYFATSSIDRSKKEAPSRSAPPPATPFAPRGLVRSE